jgi:GTPase SAR1 family protein
MGQTPLQPCKNIKILLLGHTFCGKTTFTRLLETIYTTKPSEEDLKELWSSCSTFVFARGIELLSTLCNELLKMEDLPKDEFDPKILKKMSKIKPDNDNVIQLLYDEILSIVEKKTFQQLLETCDDPVGKLFFFFLF